MEKLKLNKMAILAELDKKGKNQSWLAGQLNTSRQWVSYFLVSPGHDNMTLATISKIAEALDVDPHDLIT